MHGPHLTETVCACSDTDQLKRFYQFALDADRLHCRGDVGFPDILIRQSIKNARRWSFQTLWTCELTTQLAGIDMTPSRALEVCVGYDMVDVLWPHDAIAKGALIAARLLSEMVFVLPLQIGPAITVG